jgi:hypothetical protein
VWAGFWVNALTGVVLLAINGTEFLRNPTFYVKMGTIVLAVVCLRRLRRQVFGDLKNLDRRPIPTNAKVLAGALLALWTVATVAGRLTAYVDYVVTATVAACLTLALVLTGVVLLGRYIARLLGLGEAPQQAV